MPLIDNSKLEKIDLGNGEWVKIPSMYSYADMTKMVGETDTTDVQKGKNVLVNSIKEWNLKGSDGEVAEVTEANIMMLDVESVNKINIAITSKMNLDKKKEQK